MKHKTKSYIRDTADFISKIKQLGPIPEETILCTLDVSSLYTNIPNNEGILAMAIRRRSDPNKTPIAKIILDLLREHSLNKCIEYLNSLRPIIKFTHEFSITSINFLDTTVKYDRYRELITTLYNKPTDTHLYLNYSSVHPQSVLNKRPYGQYLRLRRICKSDKDFRDNAYKHTGYYIKRGYNFKSIGYHLKAFSES